ncbi:nuclear GTPase SLIP-GC [Aspergillus udagawae]|nr:nuclear GTPase SLIP-GC [Aspergillus udagawae]
MKANTIAFHRNVKSKTPDELSNPNVFWVGVLLDDRTPDNANYETDVLWIKCRGRTKFEDIRKQYLLRASHNEPIVFRHNGIIVASMNTIAELDTFGDRVIAIEAIKDSDLGSRTSPARRDPLEPLSNLAPANGGSVMSDTTIKREPQVWSFNNENRVPSPKPPNATGMSNLESPARLLGPKEDTQGHSTLPAGSQDYVTECAMRGFIHERLTEILPSCVEAGSSIEHHRCEFVQEWNILPSDARERYKKRALLFTRAHSAPTSQLLAELHEFTSLNAGFYQYFFSFKDDFDVYEKHLDSDLAFKMMKQNWDRKKKCDQNIWIELGRVLRHTPPQTMLYLSTTASSSGPTQNTLTENPLFQITPVKASATSDRPEPKVLQQLSLQNMFADSAPELLEAAVQQGVKLLEDLKEPLGRVAVEDASQWLQAIEKVQSQAVQPKTIVGVVGNTGAGKSSIINAMLDEERLVPTNCMRACTAVVTEISYNTSDDPYQAEIEFITREDWEKELKVLFHDLFDGSGNVSRDASNEESEAGVAYAKIKAVYPKFTREMLQNSSVEQLMRHPNVQNVLGSKREIAESDSLRFYKKLQFFVDSKEKTTAEKDKDKKPARDLEFWPLIKVVRLYVKAEALSTGAVIVDLPGVHDSNAARSAVAEGYMKQCTGLWIVAPITRAVDDKAAKSLLGDSFKRQLKMDGGFNTVTFICSKTDDISLIECQESLGLEEQMGVHWAKSDELAKERRVLKQRLEELKETKAACTASADEVDEVLEAWEASKDDIEDGKTVFAPREDSISKKRKRRSSNEKPGRRKKARTPNGDADSDYVDSDQDSNDSDDEADDEEDQPEESRVPLTKEQIAGKISELKMTKKENRRQKQDLESQIKELRKRISDIDEADAKIEAEMRAIAISGRNEYSRGAIQQDFAAGVKELDQELAEEEDAANFNPDVDARDYDQVAKSLPVFCVSSRGYQKLRGRLRKEADVHGFQSVEETEVPQLQAHCKKLTEVSREANSRRFLNSLSQLLNSLRLWSSPAGDSSHLTDGQKTRQNTMVQNKIQKLESVLEKHVRSVHQQIREEFDDNVFDACQNALTPAAVEANKTVLRWGAPVDRSDRTAGGYYWSTYKAICRRNGLYSNAQGHHDWNAELIEPIIKAIASGWEKTFSRRINSLLQGTASDAGRLLKSFHDDIEREASQNGPVASLHLLSHQLRNYQALLKDVCNENLATTVAQAKEINRMFQPVIATALEPAYETCVVERGTGSFMRMKAAMVAHVEQARWTMFRDSADTVKRAFEEMVKAVEDKMLSKTKEILSFVKRDYMSALGGSVLASSRALPSGHRVARDDVFQKINTGEVVFKQLADPHFEEDDWNPEQDDGKVGDEDKSDVLDQCASTEPSEEPTKEANIGATELPGSAVIDLPIEEASQESFVSPPDG